MTPKDFYYIRDNKTLGPVGKQELQMAAYRGEINSDTLYTYNHARKWYPLSRLIGDASKLDPKIIEDTWPRYFVSSGNEVVGPYSYSDLYLMVKDRRVNHQTLYKIENCPDWKPLSKLPVPHIPKFVPETPPRKTEWIEASKREWSVNGMNFSAKIGLGSGRTEEGYCLLKVHGPLSGYKGNLYLSMASNKALIQQMLSDGSIQLDTPCAKENGSEWLTVKDFL